MSILTSISMSDLTAYVERGKRDTLKLFDLRHLSKADYFRKTMMIERAYEQGAHSVCQFLIAQSKLKGE